MFLVFVALSPVSTFTMKELQAVVARLPQAGLEEAAKALAQVQQAAGEESDACWAHRVKPFWSGAWPQDRSLLSGPIAENLALLAVATRGRFPEALSMLSGWLRPVAHPDLIVRRLQKAGLCERFPKDALALLDAVVRDQPWAPDGLRECLTTIAQVDGGLVREPNYQRLDVYLRQRV